MDGLAMIDLDRYFARIGFGGATEPNVSTLSAIVAAHGAAIPFENLDVLLGRGISLDPAAIERKLVGARRGGYCFEQNTLLMTALEQLGFRVTPLAARVRIQQPREVLPPRTHMFLRVELSGTPWLADVGVGSLTPTAALRMDTEDAQPTSHETHRIVREEGRFFHQARLGTGEWTDVYEFTGEPMPPIDRELANWWTSTSPTSKFRLNLLVARVGPEGTRFGLQNGRFIHRRGGETLASRDIAAPDELLATLAHAFSLDFPAGTRFGSGGAPWPV
jgi:N-hydroxyarylamine O-acetyltransferase